MGELHHPSLAWQVPLVEDMLWDGKSGLTEAVVMGPGQAILFYGRQSLGEGCSLGKVCDTMFKLSGAISWVGKQAQVNTNAVSLWEGWWMIAQTITEWWAEASSPGCPHTHLPVFPPFSFHNQDGPLQVERLQSTNECMEEPRHTCQTSHHDWGWTIQCGWDFSQRWQDQWAVLTPSPSPSLDHRFEEWQKFSVNFPSSVIKVQ